MDNPSSLNPCSSHSYYFLWSQIYIESASFATMIHYSNLILIELLSVLVIEIRPFASINVKLH